jgi:hypothetical protein
MSLSIIIEGGNTINGIPFTSQMNVQNALESAYNSSIYPPAFPPLSFVIEYFGSYNGQYLGYFVTQMDGTAQQGSKYWILYVNNVAATSGIDQTILNDGDQIEFRYETYSETLHGKSIFKQVIAAKQALK